MGLSLAQHLQGLRLYQRACLVTAEDRVLREVLWAAPEVHKKSVHILTIMGHIGASELSHH